MKPSCALALAAVVLFSACSLEPPPSKLMLLNDAALELRNMLQTIEDEAGVQENLDKINKLSDTMRDLHEKLEEIASKSSGGMASMVSQRDEKSEWAGLSDSIQRQVERISEADPKAGEILREATDGIHGKQLF